MMQFVPDRIRSGVVVGSPFASWPGKIIYKDQEISPIEAKMEIVDNLVTPRAQDPGELMDETKQIYFENSPADLLVIEGGDDPIRLSPEFAGQCLSRARASGKTTCRTCPTPHSARPPPTHSCRPASSCSTAVRRCSTSWYSWRPGTRRSTSTGPR